MTPRPSGSPGWLARRADRRPRSCARPGAYELKPPSDRNFALSGSGRGDGSSIADIPRGSAPGLRRVTVVIDAGPLVAFGDANDPYFPSIDRAANREGRWSFQADNAEVDYLLGRRVGRGPRRRFIADLATGRFGRLPGREDATLNAVLDVRPSGLTPLALVVVTAVCGHTAISARRELRPSRCGGSARSCASQRRRKWRASPVPDHGASCGDPPTRTSSHAAMTTAPPGGHRRHLSHHPPSGDCRRSG